MSARVTIYAGQAVAWPDAPEGFAQVEGFRPRGRVALLYRSARGTLRKEVRSIRRVAIAVAVNPTLPGFPLAAPDNFLGLTRVRPLCRRTVEVDPC